MLGIDDIQKIVQLRKYAPACVVMVRPRCTPYVSDQQAALPEMTRPARLAIESPAGGPPTPLTGEEEEDKTAKADHWKREAC